MGTVTVQTLGAFALHIDGSIVDEFPTRKCRALLAYLLVEHQLPHEREKLMGLLWPESDVASAQASLRQAIYLLRNEIPVVVSPNGSEHALLYSTRTVVEINPLIDVVLDSAQVEAAIQKATAHAHKPRELCADCRTALQTAASLYTGDFLADLIIVDSSEFESWLSVYRERLRFDVLQALNDLAEHYIARDQFNEAEQMARRQLQIDDLRESAVEQLMRALLEQGCPAESLAAYEACRLRLRTELGVDPSAELQSLASLIRAGELPIRRQQSGVPSHNLPAQTTPFFGREQELTDLAASLRNTDVRLIAIVGPGGIGKTRLALRAAEQAIDVFTDGVVYVPLSGIDPQSADVEARLLAQLTSTLNVPLPEQDEQMPRSRRQALYDYLRNKRLLLLLDSFEHAIDAQSLLDELIRAAPQLQLLVTSRERLYILGTQTYVLDGLAVPSADAPLGALNDSYDALKMLHHHLQLADATLNWDRSARRFAAEICRLVDGFPLAIELLASSSTQLSLAEIVEQIRTDLDFVAAERLHGLSQRQRSMRTVLDASWRQLQPNAQRLLARVAVFRTGFGREAAAVVLDLPPHDLIDHLQPLIDSSLLRDDRRRRRYDLHDLIRQYAWQRLAGDPDEHERTQRRHADYFTQRLVMLRAALTGRQQSETLDELAVDEGNLRSAWAYLCAVDDTARMRLLAEPLAAYLDLRGQAEAGLSVTEAAVDRLRSSRLRQQTNAKDDSADTLAQLLLWNAQFFMTLDNFAPIPPLLAEVETMLGRGWLQEPVAIQARLDLLRGHLLERSDRLAAVSAYKRSLTGYEQCGNVWQQAVVQDAIGDVYHNLAQFDAAENHYQRACELFEAVGNKQGIGRTLIYMGFNHIRLGDLRGAEQFARRAYDLLLSTDKQSDFAYATGNLGTTLLWQGQHALSVPYLEQAVELYGDLGRLKRQASFAFLASYALALDGSYQRALRHAAISRDNYQAIGDQRGIAIALFGQSCAEIGLGAWEAAEQHLGDALAGAQTLRLRDEEGYMSCWLALAQWLRQRRVAACANLQHGLDIALELHTFAPMSIGLSTAALIMAQSGRVPLAVTIDAALPNPNVVAHSPFYRQVIQNVVNSAAGELDLLTVTAARELGKSADLWQLVTEVRNQLING